MRPREEDVQFRRFDMMNEVSSQVRREMRVLAGGLPTWQLFVPAGRSFFTSLAKAIPVFERSGMLDPITVRFGEFFLSAKQRLGGARSYIYPEPRRNAEVKSSMENFFGGKIVFRRDDEFIETKDGRLIPLPFLSSGQQELLPLWFSIEQAALHDRDNFNLYIEEPEAHIFPTTQNLLVESLSAYLIGGKKNANIIMTTHSPYVLSKINNLIKAAVVGAKRGKASAVSEVIPRSAWMEPSAVSAYALQSGKLVPLIDQEGFIDSDFLDGVSGAIAEEYMRLVDIELTQ